jgi:hypothetical protein
MSAQGELNFDRGESSAGLDRWREERRASCHALALCLGLPLNHQVEVWLRGDIRLRGILRLQEEVLFLEDESRATLRLSVEGVVFAVDEIESCVRVD